MLIDVRDNPSFWIDHDVATSGEAVAIADTYATSGVVNIIKETNTDRTIYQRTPASSINLIDIYFPLP